MKLLNPLVEAEVEKKILENMSSGKVGVGRSGEKVVGKVNPISGNQVASQDVLKIKNNLENVAKKYDVDLSDVSLTNNEFRNSLNYLSKINRSIPKGTGSQTEISKSMYQDKVDSVINLIKFVKKEKNLGKDIDYIWGYDNKKKMPFILFKEGKGKNKFIKSYHFKEKQMKYIKSNS